MKSTGTFAPQTAPSLPCLDIPVVFLDPLSKMQKSEVFCPIDRAGGGRSSNDLDLSNVSAGKLVRTFYIDIPLIFVYPLCYTEAVCGMNPEKQDPLNES